MEIERKFLLEKFPEHLPLKEESIMYQGYLSTEPVVRIRKKIINGKENYKLTIKGKGEISREEIEFKMSKEDYESLDSLLKKPHICKECREYILPCGEILQCSIVDKGSKTSFMYAEVEFETLEAAKAFIPPSFLGADVTYDNYYKMNNYWKRTRG